MNKLKNVGISALAGTLVTLSAAQAGEVSVSGSYELSYTKLDHEKVTGNPLGVNKNITFGAGGDVSDGGGVTWATTVAMNDGFSGLSSASMSINMGGIATLAYDSGTGGYGANAVDNIVPTAWEEIDYGLATGISDVGAVSASKGVINLAIKAPVAGTGISLSYASRMGDGHTSDGATSGGGGNGHKGIDAVVDIVDYSAAHAGFRLGFAGQLEVNEVGCDPWSCNDGLKHNPYAGTMFTKMQLGPIHLGTQATFKNHATSSAAAIMNQRSIVGGVAAVFSNMSVSYGIAYDKYRYNNRNRGFTPNTGRSTDAGGQHQDIHLGPEDHEYETQKYRGWSASVNFGPVALKGTHNKVDSNELTALYPHNVEHTEVNLSIAF